MCGIAGFTHSSSLSATAVLDRMLERIRHRGPDQDGTHITPAFAFGHRRLIIIAPDGGRQPRVDPASGDALLFNGEIYNFRHHAERLRQAGAHLADGSDTEVLFAALRLWGVERTLAELDGMFAFAFREGGSGTVHLARDRCGEKPLFWGVKDGHLVFGSELAAVRVHPSFADAPVDPLAARQFLSFDYIPAPLSGTAGISKLAAGHRLAFESGQVSVHAYWRPRFHDRRAAALDNPVGRLDEILQRSIAERLVADRPVGVFLSGGVDSSLVAAIAGRISPGTVAYTLRFGASSYDETPFAAEVARLCGLRHVVVDTTDDDLLRGWQEVDAKLDEPFADASIIPTYMLSREARREMVVALGGDGGDELFAGYPVFPGQRVAPLAALLPKWSGRLGHRVAARLPHSEGYMAFQFKLGQFTHGLGNRIDHQPHMWMAPFAPFELPGLTTPAFREILGHHSWHEPVDYWLEGFERSIPLERLQRSLMGTYLAEDILTKVDRASMYNALEVRAPLLARDVVEFALALPPEAKLKGSETKHLLKAVARRYLPSSLVDRKKHGFAPPIPVMLRGPLRQLVEDTVLDRGNPIAAWFDRASLERLIGDHMARRRDYRKKVWTLFQLFRFAGRPL